MSKQLILVGAACFFAAATYAQPADTTQPATLDNVTITANKLPQKQDQTGKVVTIIPKDIIEKSAGKTLGQLLNEQAGITIGGALNNLGTNQSVYMRGANAGRTLVLIDGVPAYDPSFINSETDLNFFSLGQVERIEIARGAQSTLYGSDAVAGVINIITEKSGTQKPLQVQAGLGYGSFNTLRAQAQVYGETEKLGYSLRYAKLKSDGFSSAHDKNDAGNFDDDGYNGDAVQATLNWKPTAGLSIKPYFRYSQYDTDLDAGSFRDERDYTNTNTNRMAGTKVQWQSKGTTLTANYMWANNERGYFDDSTHVPGFVKFSTNDFDGTSQFAELYGSFAIAKGLTLLAGTDYRHARMNSRYFSLSSFGPYEDVFADTSLYMVSAYASALYTYKGLNLEGGLRWNHHERYGNNATFTFNPSFAFSKAWRVFGSVASGFKAPSIYQLYSAFGNKALEPEKSMNYEIGVQQQQGRFNNRLVYFYRDIKNGLDFDNNQFQYFNIARQKVQGFELESAIKATEKLSLTLNYTHLIPTETVQSRITFKDTSYNYLLRRPRHQLQLTAGYQFTPSFYASLNGRYVSERYDVGGYKKADEKLDAYFLLGAYAEYRIRRMGKLFIDLQNITNTEFYDIRGFNSIPFVVNGGFTINL